MSAWFSNRVKSPGLVLVAVMWIIILLTVMIAVVAKSSRLDTRISMGGAEQMRLKWACRAGIETAVAVLGDDEEETVSDSYDDLWYANDVDFNDVQLDLCRFSVEVVDESSKLNVNTATKNQLLYIPDMTEEIADSIIDWRDGNDNINAGGAESGYYINMPYGYKIRNGKIKTVREMLRIKGVTQGLLYGLLDDENVSVYNAGWINYLTCYGYCEDIDVDGGSRTNISEGSARPMAKRLGISESLAQWIVDTRGNKNYKSIGDLISKNTPPRPQKQSGNSSNNSTVLDLQTFYKIADRITVSKQKTVIGRVNINTAPYEVLVAVLEGDDQIAEDIIAYRESQINGITELGQLAQISSFTNTIVNKYIGYFTTRSSVFTVYSYARTETTGADRQVEAVIDRGQSPAEILYYRSGAFN